MAHAQFSHPLPPTPTSPFLFSPYLTIISSLTPFHRYPKMLMTSHSSSPLSSFYPQSHAFHPSQPHPHPSTFLPYITSLSFSSSLSIFISPPSHISPPPSFVSIVTRNHIPLIRLIPTPILFILTLNHLSRIILTHRSQS